MDKPSLVNSYLSLRSRLKIPPSLSEFLQEENISKYLLTSLYGKNAFSKLAQECGDTPNVFSSEKSDLAAILTEYGHLVRKLQRLPIGIEWSLEGKKPTISGITKSHGLSWSQMPGAFIKFAEDRLEWADILTYFPVTNNDFSVSEVKDEECFVYLMIDTTNRMHKIGMSKLAEFRERTLQGQKPSIKLVAAKKYINRKIAGAIEKALHETYSHKRIRGEWFALSEEDIVELKATLED